MLSKKLVFYLYVVNSKFLGFCNVLVFFLVEFFFDVMKDDNKFKLVIYKLCDFMKGGIDIVE